MADGDVYKTTLEWRYSGIDVAVQNVIWFRQEGDVVGGAVPELLLGARLRLAHNPASNWPSGLRKCLSPNFAILNARVQRYWPVSTGAYLTAINSAGNGFGGPAYTPSTAAVLVRLQSVLNTRRGHGRLYLGGFAPQQGFIGGFWTMANEGYWSDGLRSAVSDYIGSLKTEAQTAGAGEPVFRLGVWSREIAGPTFPYSDGFNEVATWDVPGAIRVQRRREVGVGI